MMQNILIPTDFSRNAYHALSFVTELFKNRKCNFFLLNVYEEDHADKDLSNGIGDRLGEKSEAGLQRTARSIKKRLKNTAHTFKTISKKGQFTEIVDSLIGQLGIELVVMGSKGKKSSIPIFLGSTVTKTFKSVKQCPVLAVPKNAEIKIPDEIAFATDYKRIFDKKVIEPLRFMALLNEAPIHVVHMGEEEVLDEFQQLNLNELSKHLSPIPHSVHSIPHFVSKTKIIELFLKNMGIHMLAMVNYKGSFLEKLFREPIISKMIFHVDIPLLILPDDD